MQYIVSVILFMLFFLGGFVKKQQIIVSKWSHAKSWYLWAWNFSFVLKHLTHNRLGIWLVGF